MNRAGLETFIMNVYRAIDRAQVQFDFLVHTKQKCDYDEEILALGGKIYRISSRKKGFLRNKKDLINFFKRHSMYQVIHHHAPSLSYITPLKIAKRFGVPVRIIHAHSSSTNRAVYEFFHQWNKHAIRKYANHSFACSDTAARWFYGRAEKDYRIINNAIDLHCFRFSANKRDKFRGEFNLRDKLVFGHVGRFVEVKNHTFLIEIFNEVCKKNSEAVLLLIGTGSLRLDVEAKVSCLGLESNVVFLGARADMDCFYSAIDFFLLPSLYEGFPLVLVEAQAAGLSCAVSSTVCEQVQLTNRVKFFPLKASAEEWGSNLLDIGLYNREIDFNSLKISAFNARNVAEELTTHYLSWFKGR